MSGVIVWAMSVRVSGLAKPGKHPPHLGSVPYVNNERAVNIYQPSSIYTSKAVSCLLCDHTQCCMSC